MSELAALRPSFEIVMFGYKKDGIKLVGEVVFKCSDMYRTVR